MARRNGKTIRNKKAFSAGREVKENAKAAVQYTKSTVSNAVSGTWHIGRDFVRGLFA